MKNSIKLVLVLAVVVAMGFGWKVYRLKPKPLPASLRQQILDELAAVDVWIGSLTPDASGTTLAYINGTEKGRRLTLLNLKTLEKREIPTTNEITHVFGWSPDDRYLAFAQIPNQPEKLRQRTPQVLETWLTLYDRQTDSVTRLTAATNVMEVPFYWLPTGSFLMASRNLTNDFGEMFLGSLDAEARDKVANVVPDFTVLSEKMGAYALQGELYTLELKALRKTETGWDLKSRTIQRISDFKTNGFNALVWVRYDEARSNFLFCARPSKSNWRFLYQFNPTTQELIQLSREDTYNGQFLQGGGGYAYVINTNNSFQLAVRTSAPAGFTNLFFGGNVVAYKATPKGDKLYISAALGSEPHAIWEYAISNQALRKVAEGMNKPFLSSQVMRPAEFRLKSFDGVETPSFLFAPIGLSNQLVVAQITFLNRLRSRVKYPAVIYVPPTTSQFQRKFDPQAQIFANFGFYFAAINYRGCDGYGADYSKLANSKAAARDVLALYEKLVANPNVDTKNIFLLTSSAGMEIVSELLATHPDLWAGVAIDKPGICPIDPRFEPSKLPPMLMVIGDQDPALDSMNAFVTWTKTHQVEMRVVLHTNTGHITYNSSDRKDTLKQTTDFFLEQLR